jgi:hypothetical protein
VKYENRNTLAYVLLIIIPFTQGVSGVLMRVMKKLHTVVVSFYVNFGLMIFSAFLILVLPRPANALDGMYVSFRFFEDLDVLSWCLLVATSVGSVLGQTTKFAAF